MLKRKECNCAFENLGLRCGATKKSLLTCRHAFFSAICPTLVTPQMKMSSMTSTAARLPFLFHYLCNQNYTIRMLLQSGKFVDIHLPWRLLSLKCTFQLQASAANELSFCRFSNVGILSISSPLWLCII